MDSKFKNPVLYKMIKTQKNILKKTDDHIKLQRLYTAESILGQLLNYNRNFRINFIVIRLLTILIKLFRNLKH